MGLTKIVRAIGSFIIALFMVAIPFSCGISYVLKFDAFLQWIFTILTIILVLIYVGLIYEKSED